MVSLVNKHTHFFNGMFKYTCAVLAFKPEILCKGKVMHRSKVVVVYV